MKNRQRQLEVDVVEEEIGGGGEEYGARPTTDSYYDLSVVIGIAISAVFFVIIGTG